MAKKAARRRKLIHEVVTVDPRTLTRHPQNYNEHPPDQREHIRASIEKHGFYRNVVVSSDGYILAGHGVTETAVEMGLAELPVIQLNVKHDSPTALEVLAGDNEISRLAAIDDRQLTEVLKKIKDSDPDNPGVLRGTGYSLETLAALVLVTRPASEVKDANIAANWVGMPTYTNKPDPFRLIIAFPGADGEAERKKFMEQIGAVDETFVLQTLGKAKSIEWPLKLRAKKHPKIITMPAGDEQPNEQEA